MSKSKGNVIDPLELIDEYGADALRFTLAAMAAQGRDIKLATARVEGYRNFGTKLWNAARFAEMNGVRADAGFDPVAGEGSPSTAGSSARASARRAPSPTRIEAFRFNEAASALYQFVWNVFCDWYLELVKPMLAGNDEAAKAETRAMTAWVLDQILTLLHPFMPFVTEELWAQLASKPTGARVLADRWRRGPSGRGWTNAEADAEIDWVIRLVSEVRSVRAEMNVPAGAKVPLVISGASAETEARAKRHEEHAVCVWRGSKHSVRQAAARRGADRARRGDAGAAACRRDRRRCRVERGSSARSTGSVPTSKPSMPSSPMSNSSPARPSTWSRSSANEGSRPKPPPRVSSRP